MVAVSVRYFMRERSYQTFLVAENPFRDSEPIHVLFHTDEPRRSRWVIIIRTHISLRAVVVQGHVDAIRLEFSVREQPT